MEKFGKHCRDKDLSDATVNRSLATYRQMGRRLFDWNKIPKPFPMIKLKPERNYRTYVISFDEEKRLMDAALHDGSAFVWLFISIGLGTGLWHGEILGARFEHFDAVRRRLNVLVKGGSWRKQSLTRGVVSILERERSMAVDPDGWIFPSNRSKSGHITSMKSAFARCVKIAGMEPNTVIPHAMRHTAISRLAATGADIKTLQEFSGHLSMSMFLRYAHSQDRTVDAALDRMEGRTIVEHPAMRKP